MTDIAVVGAGPAGIATVVQLGRYGIVPDIYERRDAGGLLHEAGIVYNYPGFPGGIEGPELAARFADQLRSSGVEPIREEVRRIDYDGERFLLDAAGESVPYRTVVVATGTRPAVPAGLAVEVEAEDLVFGSILELRRFEGGRMAVIGAGDVAFDYALTLARRNRVTIIARGDRARCIPPLRHGCERSPGCTILYRTAVERVARRGKGLVITCTRSGHGIADGGDEFEIEADYLVTATGRVPELDLLAEGVIGEMNTLAASRRLFVIGDAGNERYRQTAICVGDGVRTGMKIEEGLP